MLLPLAAVLLLGACRLLLPAPPPARVPVLPTDALKPSPRLLVGRIIAVDRQQGLAFVELASEAPADALQEGTELIARTLALAETGRIRASRYVRGRTLGATILHGQPAPGEEVVWLAP